MPPGHFYSPITDRAEVAARADRLFGRDPFDIPGVDLRVEEQTALLRELLALEPRAWGPRYGPGGENDQFPAADALAWQGLLRHLRPRRVVEVGSGWSTGLLLDTVTDVSLTCVEPFPDRLRKLLRPGDDLVLLQQPFQDVPLAVVDALEAGDVLWVDSTHVLKTGSDVHHLLFTVLPRLQPGVVVHVHDVPVGFEYPREWALDGWSWNEAYGVRAFLQFNDSFEVLLHVGLCGHLAERAGLAGPPGIDLGAGGSLYLRRTR